MARRVQLVRTSLLILALALVGARARAAPPSVEDDGRTSTFRYTTPHPKDYFRAVLEGIGVLGIGFIEYLVSTKASRGEVSPPYDFSIFHDKLGGNAESFDINHFNTNFIGHPLGGTLYYQSARSNRLGVLPSFGWAFTGSLIWELIGEINEKPSYNDMIVTPWAGLSNGEVLTQLGAFFARARPSVGSTILEAIVAAPRLVHDRLDGLVEARATEVDDLGFPADIGHRFELSLGAGATWQAGSPAAFDQRLRLDTEIVALPDYAGVGDHSRAFTDGNIARLRFDLGLSEGHLVDGRFATQSTLAGWYVRHGWRDAAGRVQGRGAIAGVYVGFEYWVHDYDRDRTRTVDQSARVTMLGVSGEYTRDAGPFHLRARAQLGLDFAGAHAYALPAYVTRKSPEQLPTVLQREGYYFAAGPSAVTSLELSLAGLELGGDVAVEDWHAILGLDDDEAKLTNDVSRSDRRLRWRGTLGWTFRRQHLRVGAEALALVRSGSVGDARASRSETTLTFSLGGVF